LNPFESDKLRQSRILGKGCSCKLGLSELDRMAKKGKGMYGDSPDEVDEGEGLYNFGQTAVRKRRNPPVVTKRGAIVTGNTSSHRATYGKGLFPFGTTGKGLDMFGRSVRLQPALWGQGQQLGSESYGANANQHVPGQTYH
jgi:hypothetical protein